MSEDRLPPPNQEARLVRLRSSSQKGGTIIAEDVTDRAAHDRRLCDPDGYRPAFSKEPCRCDISHGSQSGRDEIVGLDLHLGGPIASRTSRRRQSP